VYECTISTSTIQVAHSFGPVEQREGWQELRSWTRSFLPKLAFASSFWTEDMLEVVVDHDAS
jgi:hypothetical protein